MKMFGQTFFGCLFVQLKRNDKIRTQGTGKFAGHYYRIAAEWAGGSTGAFIGNDFPAAGLAYVNGHSAGFIFLPGVV